MGLPEIGKKLSKMGSFPPKILHKSGYDGNCRQLEEGCFLETRRQTLVHPPVMYPPPPRCQYHLNASINNLNKASRTNMGEMGFLHAVPNACYISMLHLACTKLSSNQQPRIRLWFTDFEPISKICYLWHKSMRILNLKRGY